MTPRLSIWLVFIISLALAIPLSFRAGQYWTHLQDGQLERVNYEALPVVQDFTYCRRAGSGKSKYHEIRIIKLEGVCE